MIQPASNCQPNSLRLRGSLAVSGGFGVKTIGVIFLAFARAPKSFDCASPQGVLMMGTVPAFAGGMTEPSSAEVKPIAVGSAHVKQ